MNLLWLVLPVFMALFAAWPLPQEVLHPPSRPTTAILDRNDKLLYELRSTESGLEHPVMLAEIPETLIQAVLAREDRTFYRHSGVSLRGILRAAWQNFRAGRIVSGGSTITQQLVRSRLGSRERSIRSKLLEALYALKIERAMSKEEILTAYLNTAYFGHQAYGVRAAARTYLGQEPRELSLAQSAFLAGLLQAPSSLDPFANFPGAKERQRRVLAAMRYIGALSEEQAREAEAEPISLASGKVSIRAPHFVQWLLTERPEAFEGVSDVRTTIDLSLQEEVERIVEANLADLREKNVTSAAVVVLDVRTGDLLSMVGSADYFDAEHAGAVNVALAPRQPGSALKPFTYALALAQGDTPATTVADTEARFFTQEGNPYIPRNYDYGEHGLVRYREALANSYNIAAVKVAERVGVGKLLSFLRAAGITTLRETPEHYGLALTLGDGEVRLLELTEAYGVFPRLGRTLAARTLLADPVREGDAILDPRVAWLITDILSDPEARLPEFGESGPLSFEWPVAAKTGTTRNSRDNWTIGYTPDVLVGVWVGNADNSPMRETSGVSGAGPIFHDVLMAALEQFPPRAFERPPGISERAVCRLSGKLQTPLCPQSIIEKFVAGTEPREPDDLFRSFSVDKRNGLLAGEECDPSLVAQRVFTVFPKELRQWARENGYPLPPAEPSPLCGGAAAIARGESWLEITRPQAGESFQRDPLIPDRQERVIFEASASEGIVSVEWWVNGEMVGAGTAPDFRFAWEPVPEYAVIEARSGSLADTVTVEVMD